MRLYQRNIMLFILIVSILVVIGYYYMEIQKATARMRKARRFGYWKYRKNSSFQKPNVRIYDLKQPLKQSVSDSIQCRRSGEYQKTTVTLCLHDQDRDVVSKALWINGLWEEHIMRVFTYYITRHPDWLVIDAGAQIGQYSLFAAKLGSRVITIEPFYDNIIRIHKAALEEKLSEKITLIQNALFDKRNQIKQLSENTNNIGGQSLIEKLDLTFSRTVLSQVNIVDKFFVETILFDDIIEYLPRQTGGRLLNDKAIIKIDIEGLEPYVIPAAVHLFDVLRIQIVFMEWGKMPLLPEDMKDKVTVMIEFFLHRDFVPFSIENMKLNLERWPSWPFDMYWIQKELVK